MDERRHRHYQGLFFDEFEPSSAWIRETGLVRLPPLTSGSVTLRGELRPYPGARGLEVRPPQLEVLCRGQRLALVQPSEAGPFSVDVSIPHRSTGERTELSLRLRGVGFTNFLAWLGRVTRWPVFGRFRGQHKNRQLRICQVEAAGEVIFDFSNRHSPYSIVFARRHLQLGMNIVGYLTADLGIGESARCMVRAADAAVIPSALINLRLPVKNTRSDLTYSSRLQENNVYPVNVVHLDPPGARDLDHHHGRTFRSDKYNIGYWAWELPEFPDSWAPYFDYYDEIWCPSRFVADAVGMKSPVPVITMPHAISFRRPAEAAVDLRRRFGLPQERFLFLFIYDLNSYSARKNPQAVLAAFRAAGLADKNASLVIKTHSTAGNEQDLAALREAVADLPGTVLITETLERADLYALEAACDCFVSLHRSEGFGLAIAECMYLGKPVISTDWSAPAEYLNEENGCPVRATLKTLERNIGPYSQGQVWAEPDIAHAAGWMQRIHGDSDLRSRLGAAARSTIEQRFSPATIGARYRKRLEAIAVR